MTLSFEQLAELGPTHGVHDLACPLCSHQVSARGSRRRVLQIWRDDEHFASFACARCGEKGWARAGDKGTRPSPERLAAIRRDAAARQAAEQAESLRKARWLWSSGTPITSATPAFTYLREPRAYHGPIPATLRYLRPRKPEHHHAMIAAVGMAHELEPGAYTIANDALAGVHLTLLRPDGSAKADDVENAKLIIGQGSSGCPICLMPPNDLLGLAIAEGIEDALSIHEATGLGAWAAGCANRLPCLAENIPSWVNCVTIAADADRDGRRNALALGRAIEARGIEAILQGLGP